MSDLYSRISANKRINYRLSVIILSLPNRLSKLQPLLEEIKRQSVNAPVQIIYLGDNKSMTVGEKRNLALSCTSGEYITFIDDDDEVSPNYISEILKAAEETPEVIAFKVQRYRNGELSKLHQYYLNAGRPYLSPDRKHYKMSPNHLCAWRRDIVKEKFPNKSLSEDHEWAELMSKHYTEIHFIDEILYHYKYDTELSETHKGSK